jgi:hypothetical protein
MSQDPVIGRRPFTDGVERDVYLDAEGQYIVDDGERVRRVWHPHADEPVIVHGVAATDDG